MKTERQERTKRVEYRGYQPKPTSTSKYPPPPPSNMRSAVSRPQESNQKK